MFERCVGACPVRRGSLLIAQGKAYKHLVVQTEVSKFKTNSGVVGSGSG